MLSRLREFQPQDLTGDLDPTRKRNMFKSATRPILLLLCLGLLGACSTRQVQDSLVGATAQQLVTHSIDDLMRHLPAEDFAPHAGKQVHLSSHFVDNA